MLMLNRDSEIVICSRFMNCELWSCDMNSTLGSVVPLAMFRKATLSPKNAHSHTYRRGKHVCGCFCVDGKHLRIYRLSLIYGLKSFFGWTNLYILEHFASSFPKRTLTNGKSPIWHQITSKKWLKSCNKSLTRWTDLSQSHSHGFAKLGKTFPYMDCTRAITGVHGFSAVSLGARDMWQAKFQEIAVFSSIFASHLFERDLWTKPSCLVLHLFDDTK